MVFISGREDAGRSVTFLSCFSFCFRSLFCFTTLTNITNISEIILYQWSHSDDLLLTINRSEGVRIGIIWCSTGGTKTIQIFSNMMPTPHAHLHIPHQNQPCQQREQTFDKPAARTRYPQGHGRKFLSERSISSSHNGHVLSFSSSLISINKGLTTVQNHVTSDEKKMK